MLTQDNNLGTWKSGAQASSEESSNEHFRNGDEVTARIGCQVGWNPFSKDLRVCSNY